MTMKRITELEAMHERGTIRRGHIDEMLSELRRLHEANEELLGALQNLYDEQNDAPLERHRVWWKAAMEKARAAIAKHGEKK